MNVTVELINQAKTADEDLWNEYIHSIHPDEQQYLPYHLWLSLKIKIEQ